MRELIERIALTESRIPSSAPAEVKKVAKAFLANAKKAGKMNVKELGEKGKEAKQTMDFWAGRLYVEFDKTKDGPRWSVGDNYERTPFLIHYPDLDKWMIMSPYGSERPIRGGFKEALANAEIMFTG